RAVCRARLSGGFYALLPAPPRSTLFPYTTLFRSQSKGPEKQKALRKTNLQIQECSRRNIPAVCEKPQTGQMVTFLGFSCWYVSRSEEHTSELQSRENLVCRLLLEKKKTNSRSTTA